MWIRVNLIFYYATICPAMGRIDVILPEELEKKFRMEVAKRKGMKKGNIKESLEEAIVNWIG
jgi:hypothetical protein